MGFKSEKSQGEVRKVRIQRYSCKGVSDLHRDVVHAKEDPAFHELAGHLNVDSFFQWSVPLGIPFLTPKPGNLSA